VCWWYSHNFIGAGVIAFFMVLLPEAKTSFPVSACDINNRWAEERG
jgi:hypothetical protein